jgi:NarL family two-component system response regulator LiaR
METPQANTESEQGRIGVVVADAYPAMCSGLVHELKQQPDMVVLGTAANGDQALDLAQTLRADVLLLDFSLPGLPTVEVARRVRELRLITGIVLLTTDNDPDRVTEALHAGVQGCLLKTEPIDVIVNAVRAVMHEQMPLSAAIAAGMVRENVLGAAEPAQPAFTPRELNVLRLLAQAKSNQEIADLLSITERAVREHLTHIYNKLKVRDRNAALAWAVRHGLDEE